MQYLKIKLRYIIKEKNSFSVSFSDKDHWILTIELIRCCFYDLIKVPLKKEGKEQAYIVGYKFTVLEKEKSMELSCSIT